jgi:hypothetical protein
LAVAAVCDRRDFEEISPATALTERRYRTLAEVSITVGRWRFKTLCQKRKHLRGFVLTASAHLI